MTGTTWYPYVILSNCTPLNSMINDISKCHILFRVSTYVLQLLLIGSFNPDPFCFAHVFSVQCSVVVVLENYYIVLEY